ncbi:MAG TPA: glucoamylase family protein [Methanotrichaceae archaeon]|nr:glucoamylase family protein [Methanotrichaceae archaeon]
MIDLNALRQSLSRLRARLRSRAITDRYERGQPLRSELFSLDLLERHAKTLAEWHEIDARPGRDLLLPRLAENEEILLKVYQLVTEASEKNLKTAPAAAWLLDNFYRVEEQIRISRKHLPRSYSRELPHLVRGPLAGFPRVYDITRELIIHSDGRVDAENLNRFVAAYQQVKTLKLGELWAIPIMLRLGLIENIRRISMGIAISRIDRDMADYWADRLIETAESDPRGMIMVLARLAESDPPISSTFVSELARRLQGQSPALALPIQWIEQRLSEKGLTMDQMIQSEIQKDAQDRVSIGNSMESFRFLEAMDWRRFVETMSAVEKVLSRDPAGIYARMDFSTRDRYRHVVEKTARRSQLSEEEVAAVAVRLASQESKGERFRHVGYYLVDKGQPAFETQAGMEPTLNMRLGLKRSDLLIYYLGSIALITIIISVMLLAVAYHLGLQGWLTLPTGLLLVVCVSSLAIALVNCLATLIIKPQPLPRMDLSEGIPDDLATLVAIPMLLRDIEKVEDLINDIEVQYLANQSDNLYFCLLTDLPDAANEDMHGDERLVLMAQEGISALNKKYSSKFFLFHRARSWNPQDKVWMGYERKRGILEDLNYTLKSGPEERFSLIVGDRSILPRIKYVITLDADTRMPRGSAGLLIGTMSHILNHPVYDEKRQCVIDGYSILHPRLNIGLPEANRSRFARLFGGEPGLDPYTREVSDVYQDLFREGSFAGKGIYDADAFSRSLSGRFPENLILSHDLLEGCYARSGLVSDVQFYEEYPYRYTADVSRRHRWIRGDWQIARWLLSRVPGPGALRLINPLSRLSRWKILDNLRRSLVPAAQVLLLLLGWMILPAPWFWTISVVGISLVPSIFTSAISMVRKPEDMPIRLHLASSAEAAGRNVAQALLGLIFLPYEAFFSLDAVLRALMRVLVTHKRLLEWNTASETIHNGSGDLSGFYLSMWSAPAVAAAAAAYLAIKRPGSLYIALPLLFLWLASPGIAWWVSLPLRPCAAKLHKDQKDFLHKLARRTWRFFETFVTHDSNWLPPDNYQEYPRSVIANGTSPTNMGLSLLASLSAYDFGYISAGKMLERLESSLKTMEGLEKFRTHFYNWYDTKLLEPLQPRYISTVDSGNLAGHLLVLQQGLLEMPCREILRLSAFSGLRDTMMVIIDEARGLRKQDGEVRTPASPDILARLEQLLKDLESPPTTLSAAWMLFDQHTRAMSEMADRLDQDAGRELRWWIDAYESQLRDLNGDITLMAPWLMLPLWAMLHPSGEDIWLCSSAEQARMLIGLREELLQLDRIPALQEVPVISARQVPLIDQVLSCLSDDQSEERDWFLQLKQFVIQAGDRARARMDSLQGLAVKCQEMADMEYAFLFSDSRQLLSIGYNVNDLRRDESCYDLLASEARLTSFLAIAQGKLRQDHWFSLGRQLTTAGGELALLSWGGTMFEYLMPALVMPTYENTLLDQTYKAVVRRQIEYGQQRSVPWGISESGYNMTDVNLIYQYRAFGVPGLGFKRGLAEDLVIAPYASALALMVAPAKACSNLQRMADEGYLGDYGLYEAIDYTPSRLSRDQSSATVRSFMSHHQGMSFLSLAHLLLDRPMQRRFCQVPIFQATDLLLQEKVPKAAPFYPHAAEVTASLWRAGMKEAVEVVRILHNPSTPSPEIHLLSNGRYSVMVTNSGSGYSLWKDQGITRWHRDPTRDDQGTFIYMRDMDTEKVWSAGYQPTLRDPDFYEAAFQSASAEFWRRDSGIDTYYEVVVSPEDDIELRHLSITNRTSRQRTIELTSYVEAVLTSPAADIAHPAFGKLFIQTEVLEDQRAIICNRRPRSRKEETPWMVHLVNMDASEAGETSYETSRSKFTGRSRTLADPEAMHMSRLSGSFGPALDPCAAIRCSVVIDPGETARVNFITGAAGSRDAALGLAAKYRDFRMAERISDLAWTHGQVVLQQLNASEAEIQRYERLASAVIYPSLTWRASFSIISSNRSGQSGLWAYGISGDLPIVLLKVSDQSGLDLVRQLLKAHAYWRMMGLSADLVIWNEDQGGYRQTLHDAIMGLISSSTEAGYLDRPGGVFARRADQMTDQGKILIQSVASAIITDAWTLEDQLQARGRGRAEVLVPRLVPARDQAEVESEAETEAKARSEAASEKTPPSGLIFYNGLGGFTSDGREYITKIEQGQNTPAPWSNVLANPNFGTIVSESGSSYTWSENSHEFRITPWYNDPVTDISGEAFYIRDEDSGRFWSPTALPTRGRSPYTCRHGLGYSVFEHSEEGIKSELWVYVSLNSPVKFSVLRIKNESGRHRRVSATGYFELVLGEVRSRTMAHIITEVDPRTGAVFARNPYSTEFPDRVAFLDVNDPDKKITGDRTEFLGRNGTLSSPAAMARVGLSGRVGTALDPCLAAQAGFDLEVGQERELVFVLGSGRDMNEARSLVQRFRGSGPARSELEAVWKHWNRTLGVVYVETPDPALNVLTNGWLIYQVLACRLWARSGYYQSSGAFGFRDQLQDVMALLYAQPGIAREQIMRCASRQFVEGDVQHWWHPHSGRGVRTHISDDYLWLPWAVCLYTKVTGDCSILDERMGFLEGRPVKPEDEAYYDLPVQSAEAGTIYEHCARAVRYGLKFGAHGLPLMGSGDWNDGMNLVGHEGRGESVWLAFFLCHVLDSFEEVAARKEDQTLADLCHAQASALRQKIEESGWDGSWYRRAYFDDGRPLGSESDPECQIDSIAQSWSVLSGAEDEERSRQAMRSLHERLVRKDGALIQLLDQPFDKSDLEPGYIKGYLPGVRENGAQYTHAAVWAVMAFAAMGDSGRAWELLSMINPINHSSSSEGAMVYKVEPYIMAADVYSTATHLGRGGWTWYTGAAGWMYRLIVELLLGLKKEAGRLSFAPCPPESWESFKVHYRHGETFYHISVVRSGPGCQVISVMEDGKMKEGLAVELRDDRKDHQLEVRIGQGLSL